MLITFNCPSCSAKYESDSSHRAPGSSMDCPNCGETIQIPKLKIGPGVTIGGFAIESKLGEGAMGQVFLAIQKSMDRKVALKILPPQMTRDETATQRFQQEVRMAAKLEHPNLVAAYQAGEDNGIHYLAIRYIDGITVLEKIHQQGKLSELEALKIIRKIADALQLAWNRHQLLHRDIKPENIMLENDGEPQLMDLGLAKSLSEGSGLTQTSTAMGTPNYMSPDQIESAIDIDCKSDIYSLGASLYHMVTGEAPYSGATITAVLMKQLTEPLADPRSFTPELSQGCLDLIEGMACKDKALRYQRYEDVIQDLNRILRKEPLTPPTRPQKTAAPVQKSRPESARPSKMPVVLFLTTFLLLAVGAVCYINQIFSPTTEKPTPPNDELTAHVSETPSLHTNNSKSIPKNSSRTTTIQPQQKPEPSAKTLSPPRFQNLLIALGLQNDANRPETLISKVQTNLYSEVQIASAQALATQLQNSGNNYSPSAKHTEFLQWVLQLNPKHPLKITQARLTQTLAKLVQNNSGSLKVGRATVSGEEVVVKLKGDKSPTDLSALKGLPITSLSITACSKVDLRPLIGMPLTHINFYQVKVPTYAPLKNLPISRLSMNPTPLKKAEYIAQMPLTFLSIPNNRIKDFEALRGKQITLLNLFASQVSDLSPFKGMPLEELNLNYCSKVSDLSPLRGAPIRNIGLRKTSIPDLQELKHLQSLTRLDIEGCLNSSDLSPLKDLALEEINLNGHKAVDLEPLRNMPLKKIKLSKAENIDLSPLIHCPLEYIDLRESVGIDPSPLKKIKSLKPEKILQ